MTIDMEIPCRLITGALAEVDPKQLAISRKLTPAQQFRQEISMTHLAEQVMAYRRQQGQGLSPIVKQNTKMSQPEIEFSASIRLVLDAFIATAWD